MSTFQGCPYRGVPLYSGTSVLVVQNYASSVCKVHQYGKDYHTRDVLFCMQHLRVLANILYRRNRVSLCIYYIYTHAVDKVSQTCLTGSFKFCFADWQCSILGDQPLTGEYSPFISSCYQHAIYSVNDVYHYSLSCDISNVTYIYTCTSILSCRSASIFATQTYMYIPNTMCQNFRYTQSLTYMH